MRHSRLFQALLWLSLALSAVLLGLALFSSNAQLSGLTSSQPLHFAGEYSLNGSAERFPYTKQTDFPVAQVRSVTLFGHFTQAVLPNTQVVMHISNLQVRLSVNGATVFTFGDLHPAMVRSAGNVWTAFTTDGILPTDTVQIQLTRVYPNETLSSYHDFLEHLSSGSEYHVYCDALSGNLPDRVLSLLVLLVGLAMLCVSGYTKALKLPHASDTVYLSAFVLASGLWMCIDYSVISLILPYPAFNQTLEMLCMALMPVFIMRYMTSLVRKAYQRLCLWVTYGMLAVAIVGCVLQLFGVTDLASLTGVLSVFDLAGISVFTVCLARSLPAEECVGNRSAIWPLFFLFIGAALNMANYFFAWRTNGLFFTVFFLLFAFMEMSRLVQTLRDGVRRNNEYAKLENELIQSRIAVMLSQIKPHFLFNALNSISALCLTDPLMADQAITSLSNYLRGNIRSLEQNAPVPFEQELDHIKYYVRLEQLRYGEKLRVVYAIHTTDFQVPTLSLQTLVENAIRHGVSPKPEGGLVVVQTERGDGCTLVRIIDNGVGFDPDMRSKNADSIGLANAKKRMEVMMNAQFEVQSIPGKGTTITIRIPDGRGEDQP
ncbi:MAG TPA: histidine kinase [Candidatus Limiplasma sp.]|nr:histidine kinase [Candidatus Limiplasma sp.]HPS80508.1 histidine kinase [Candidatus Limiplasma sp.]